MPKKELIIYHANCADGFGAAYAAWKRLGDKADYRPAAHGTPPPAVAGRRVTIVDFSYPRRTLLAMHEKADDLLVLDHHKSALDDLEGLPFARFDLDKSGAVLAWEHWHDTPVPDLLRYVQDKDLWSWELERSAEVSAALASHPMQFELWDRLEIDDLQRDGVAILRFQDQLVAEICRSAGRRNIAGHDVPCVNSPVLQSYIGNELAKDAPFAAIWHELPDGGRRYSLRSTDPDGLDVAEIAKRFGGGGHPRAAGYGVNAGDVG